MRIRVRVSAGEPFAPAALGGHVGEVLPLRIGSLAFATTLIAAEPDGDGGHELELEVHDCELAFEAWHQRVVAGGAVGD